MWKKITESYFYRIFVSIFTVSLVFSVIMGGIISVAFYRFYNVALQEECKSTVEKLQGAMETAVESYEQVILTLEGEDKVTSFLEGETQDTSELMRELYLLKNSLVYNASISVVRLSDRQWLSSTDQVMADSHANFQNWGVFRKAKETEEIAVYAVARDAMLSANTRICLAKAYRAGNGEILGYFLVEMPRSTIDEMVKEYSDQYNTRTVIVNKSASVIYHTDGVKEEGLGKGEDYGAYRELSDDDGVTEQNYVFVQDNSLQLMFLQELPSGTLSFVMKTIGKAMIPGILIIMVLALFIARKLARSVSRPIQKIIRAMDKIKEGNLSVRVNFQRKDEIGQLGQAFDAMTERVEELVERVDEEKHSLWIAETRSLSLQMNPHFLYNTLDLIKWNAKLGQNQEIVDITVLLGRVLRRIMNTKNDLVDVDYELEIVSAFVDIQKKHFGDRLQMTLDVEEEIRQEQIPKLVIQPIVENSIVHGFSGQAGLCEIRITGKRQGEKLVFCVTDNGAGIPAEELEHILEFKQEGMHHIGLNNVQRRARLFGDESCGITVESEPGKGTTVTLVLTGRRA